jgi:hypothetical protein
MVNHNYVPSSSDDSNSFEIPKTPAEMFPAEFDPKSGHAKETIIPEMLAMGHLMEAGRLVVGDAFFTEPAETLHICGRSNCNCENADRGNTTT